MWTWTDPLAPAVYSWAGAIAALGNKYDRRQIHNHWKALCGVGS